MDRRLVITADDLGVDSGTNAAIVALLQDGLVSASTLIPVAPAAADAVDRIKAAGVAAPRLHLTLSSARELAPWRPVAAGVRSLTGANGAFPVDAAVAERRASIPDLARELGAQLGWMHRMGLRPSGLDSHSGTLYGLHGRSLASAAVDFCAAHDMTFRLPRGLGGLLPLAVRGLKQAHHAAVQRADAQEVRLPQTLASSWTPGRLVLGYHQLRAEVLHQLRRLPDGVSELIVHPAPRSATGWLPRAGARKRAWELRLLSDPVFHRTLRRERIEIVPGW